MPFDNTGTLSVHNEVATFVCCEVVPGTPAGVNTDWVLVVKPVCPVDWVPIVCLTGWVPVVKLAGEPAKPLSASLAESSPFNSTLSLLKTCGEGVLLRLLWMLSVLLSLIRLETGIVASPSGGRDEDK